MNKQENNGVTVVKFTTYEENYISAVKAALQKIKVSLFSSSCLFCVIFLDSCVIGPLENEMMHLKGFIPKNEICCKSVQSWFSSIL